MVVLSSLIRGNVTREGTTRELVRRRRARLVSPRIPRVSDAPEGTTKLLQSKRLGTAALAPLVLSPAGAALAAASENPPAALAQPEAVGLTLQQVIQIAVENPWATLAVCGVLAYAIPKLLEKFLLPIVAVGLLLVVRLSALQLVDRHDGTAAADGLRHSPSDSHPRRRRGSRTQRRRSLC